ncbi:MAG: glycosyltransferase family 2 protein [Paracoccaceae bacterium]
MTVIVPAHQAETEIGHCLDGLAAAGFARDEIIVVDDGSRDATGALAAERGVRVIRNETPMRPARARNRGAEAADGEILFFVDADVVAHPGARAKLEAHFADPRLDAVFGSYDDRPPAPALVSRYRNLLHHFVHQRSATTAKTFWTGFGAVRRERFLTLGGLDRDWENIEDVEFGMRLARDGGAIRLDKTLLATHLKGWTLRSMFLTDLHGRAKPWTRLLMRGDAEIGDLNTAPEHRASAAAVALGAASIVALPVVDAAAWGAVVAVALFLGANAAFIRFLADKRGVGFAVAAMPYHVTHYAAALLGYASVRLERWRR